MTREGQEDRHTEREGERDETEDEREKFVTEASKVKMETKTRQGHFFPLHILSSSCGIHETIAMSDCTNLYVKG